MPNELNIPGFKNQWEKDYQDKLKQQNSPTIPAGMNHLVTYDNSNDPLIAAPYQSPFSTDYINNDKKNSDINPYLMGLFGVDILTQYESNVQDKQNFMKRQQDIFRGSVHYNNSMYGKNENAVYAAKGIKAVQPHNANVIAEGGETVFNPLDPSDDGVKVIEGPSHEEGGVPVKLDLGDVIAGNLIIPKGQPYAGKTFKAASKLLDTEKDYKTLGALRSTQEDKTSAKLNISHKQQMLAQLAQLQQSLNGNKTASADTPTAEEGIYAKDSRTKETMRMIEELNNKAKNDGISMTPTNVEEFKTYMGIEDNKEAAIEFEAFKKDPNNYVKPQLRAVGYEPYKSKGASDRTKIGGVDNSSKLTAEQIDELATRIGYRGTKSNDALQKYLLYNPKYRDKVAELHKKYGMPLAGKENDKLWGVRWDAVLQDLATSTDDNGVSATVPTADDPTVPKTQQPELPGYEAKIGEPKFPVSGQTPYQMQNLPFNQTLPYITGFAAALNPYNYTTPDYTHWEQSKQEVNIRPQLEDINQMFNRASGQTTGSPSIDASRRASLYGQSLNAKNQAYGQAQNQNAQMALNVDQFNINARTQEQNLDVQGYLPVYNEFMASAQDNAATERQAAIANLSNTYNKNYQNEAMKKLYDDSVLRHMSLQGNTVTKDKEAKANFTIPEWFQEYLDKK